MNLRSFFSSLSLAALAFSLTACSEPQAAAEAPTAEPGSAQASAPPPAPEPAGTWHSELYPADWSPTPAASFATDKILQDFSYAGYARGERPIPDHAGAAVINAVEAYGADPTGATDSTAAIQSALDAAGISGGGVVYLPAGTYHVSPQGGRAYALSIKRNNVVLRGAGAGKTFLLNTSIQMRGKSVIRVASAFSTANWKAEEKPVTAITADLMGPTLEIPVADTTGFQVGDMVIVAADPTEDWIKEHHEELWLPYANKIGAFHYLRRIEAVDAARNVLRIDIPTRYYLKTRDHARVYKKNGLLREVGLEDFSIGNVEHPGTDGWGMLDFAVAKSGYTKRLVEGFGLDKDFADKKKSAQDVHFSFLITFEHVLDGWIRRVDSFADAGNRLGVHMLSNGIRLKECRGVTVANCTMGPTQYGGGGGNGYKFRLDNCNDCLFVDDHAIFSRHGFSQSGMASAGNVFLRCTDTDTASQVGGTGHEETAGRSVDSHMYFSHSNLYDSCTADNSWFEARDRFFEKMSSPKHNTTSAHTVFWNIEGVRNSFHPFVVWSQQADYGYVIGTKGAVSAVRLDGNNPDRFAVFDPVDHVEGEGKGATLEPQSLYEDQLRRRLGQAHAAAP